MTQLDPLLTEYAALEAQLSDPLVIGEPDLYLKTSKRFAELSPIVTLARELRTVEGRRAEALELLGDPELAELAQLDLEQHTQRIAELEAELARLLEPRDPLDALNAIVEIRAGAGGAEAALFAADLYRMYVRFAEILGLKIEPLDSHPSELGGFSKLSFEVTGRDAYSHFKFESGVHRVQRVPATEAQGRIHTSTATVAVLAQVEEVDVKFDPSEVRVDVYRSSGPGGQGVNTTDSAVRLTYRFGTPEEIVVTCQDGRSQIKNKEKAFAILRAKLYERARQAEAEKTRQARLAQIGSGERSEKIRTYNFPQNRVTDHRLEGEAKNYPLESVMIGNLAPITQALVALEREARLNEVALGAGR